MYAGFWRRFAAAIVDLLILVVPMVVLGIVVALITGPKSRETAAVDMSLPVVIWLYFAIMESSSAQATIGKRMFGIRVVDLQGDRVSFFRACARFLAKIFSALSLAVGFLMAAFTPRKQALHDMVTGCLVVRKEVAVADLRLAGLPRPMTAGRRLALLIAVVCIPLSAVGAAIAVPMYQDYLVRTQLRAAVESGRSATVGVTTYMLQHKTAPRSLEEAQAAPLSPHLRDAVITREGTIVLTLAIGKFEGKRIAFVPSNPKQQKIVWTCTSDEIAPRYLPKQCRARQ
jgi:uncharacterized RDD family membrane protein YckC/Tfp pilus assembly major pilin PilA